MIVRTRTLARPGYLAASHRLTWLPVPQGIGLDRNELITESFVRLIEAPCSPSSVT